MYKIPSIFIGLISMEGSERQDSIMHNWLNKLKLPNSYAFITKPTPMKNYNYITPPDFATSKGWTGEDKDRAIKRMAGMEYFLKHKEFDYYWSITDDIMVDIDNLDMMLMYLMKRYNTNKDRVFIGQNYLFFLQGAVGFVMSRAAAEIVYPKRDEWIKNFKEVDDIETDKFRIYLGLQQADTYSPFVYGEEPTIFLDKDFLDKVNHTCIRKKLPWSKNFPLPRLIAMHSRYESAVEAMRNLIRVKENITNIYYRYNNYHMELCIGEKYNYFDLIHGE